MDLSRDDFLQLVRTGPLVSIDLIVRDDANRVLLGLRINQPVRGFWFTPGGRIQKGELLDDAFARITQTELGVTLPRADGRLVGVFEHLHDHNFAGVQGVGTHYIVLAYELRVAHLLGALPETQHEAYRWFWPLELREDPGVHPYVKAYFGEV